MSATDRGLILKGLTPLTCRIDDCNIDNTLQANKLDKYMQTPLPSIILRISTPADSLSNNIS